MIKKRTYYRLIRIFKRSLGINAYPTLEEYRSLGIKIGENTHIMKSEIDELFPELLTIGNNVTITNAKILVHDASMKNFNGYVKYGKVEIGDDVFIGMNAVILPNTHIGNRVILGAGSIVSGKIPSNTVCTGNPARPICDIDEFLSKQKVRMGGANTTFNKLTSELTEEEKQIITCKEGFVYLL